MSMMFSVAAAEALRPDPDENSEAIATLDPSDVVTIEKTLDPWTKVTLTKAGVSLSGWLVAADLIPIEQGTVKLVDEPLGSLLQTVTGRLDVLAKVATWTKVWVTKFDGSPPSLGWTQDAGAPPDPAKTVGGDAPAAGAGAGGSPGGSPAEVVDLVLGVNERYRDALLQAHAITSIDPAALATLIDAEAAKTGSGPDAGVWDPKSSNSSSHAGGLTQFVPDTWGVMACRAGTLLNRTARQKGLPTNDQTAASRNAALLDLRFDPTMSIVTAAEYGVGNFDLLVKDKLVDPSIGDDERARFIYLAHHEGLAGAEHFLRDDETIEFSKLATQVGTADAAQRVAAAGGNVTIAYRNWLNDFIEHHIVPSRFRAAKTPPGVVALSSRALGKFGGPPIDFDSLVGERADLVLETQQMLSNLGYLDPPPDGFMGPTTRWALNEFCKRNNLSAAASFTKEIAAALLRPNHPLPDIRPGGAWLDPVIAYMVKKGYFISRHPDCKNIIYVEGVDSDGKLNPQTPNVFEDLRIVFSIGQDGVPIMQSPWIATTRAGRDYVMHPASPKGAARIAPAQYKSWHVGIHKGPESAEGHEALIQCAPTDVYRDANKDFKREGPIDTGIFGINQHWGFNAPKDNIGNTSAGCLVGEEIEGHRAFMGIVKADPRFVHNNGYTFMTAVIPQTAFA